MFDLMEGDNHYPNYFYLWCTPSLRNGCLYIPKVDYVKYIFQERKASRFVAEELGRLLYGKHHSKTTKWSLVNCSNMVCFNHHIVSSDHKTITRCFHTVETCTLQITRSRVAMVFKEN